MKSPATVSGLQIAFFILALNFVSMGIARKVLAEVGAAWDHATVFRTIAFSLGAILIASFPAARRLASASLRTPIPASRRAEVAVVAIANALMPLAIAGAIASWDWLQHGAAHMQQLVEANSTAHDRAFAWAFSRSGVFMLIASVLAAPVIEEVVFRGFLFRAWERQWGWKWSAVLTSIVFGIYHPHFVAAFVESLIFIAVLRRTGSLAAPVAVHAVYNLFVWYPLIGQYMVPRTGSEDVLSTWGVQLAALAFAAVAVPAYVWLSAKHR